MNPAPDGLPADLPPPTAWGESERWFHRLVQLDAAARRVELDRILSTDPPFGRDLESLLQAHERLSVLDRPPGRMLDILARLRRQASGIVRPDELLP